MDFPATISFTLTNACNLRCRMCGQWSEEGYMRDADSRPRSAMALAHWTRLVDEVADHGVGSLLLRGGEPFLFPGIRELLEHISSRGLFVSIDSNGTRLEPFADQLVSMGRVHVTVSVDGPEAIHDEVRGIPGSFRKMAEGVASIRQAEARHGKKIGLSLTFTISPWSYRGLGALPDVARELGIETLCIVPYYYVPEALGHAYERELREELGTPAFSWRGFHHETSGVDPDEFVAQLRTYRERLGSLADFPYLPLTEEQYRTWFTDPVAPVRPHPCTNVEKLIDIQPTGEANFCVDFPDYSLGNARESTIAELWNGERAKRFRERRRAAPLSACHRCGARHMSEIGG